MPKTLKAFACAFGVLALTAGSALAGGGCGGAVTAHSGGSSEVAQIDQSQQSLPQTPQPATKTN